MTINFLPTGGGGGDFGGTFRIIDSDITLETTGQIIIFDPQPGDNSDITVTFDIDEKEVSDAVIIVNTAAPNLINLTFNNEPQVLGFDQDSAIPVVLTLASTMFVFDGSNWVRIEAFGFTTVTENA